ncbi:hypothetical protein ABIA33_004460 [Streptacidiphilus sp. MAP12-16]
MPGWVTATTPVPATVPAKETTPSRGDRTSVPTGAARSTPRCPAAHGIGGGSKRRTTSESEPPVGSGRNPVGPTSLARGPAPSAPAATRPPLRGCACACTCCACGPAIVIASHSSRPSTSSRRRPSGRGGRAVAETDRSGEAPRAEVMRRLSSPTPTDRRPARPPVDNSGGVENSLTRREERPPPARVARCPAVPVHFTRDPACWVDFARPATGASALCPPGAVPLGPQGLQGFDDPGNSATARHGQGVRRGDPPVAADNRET